MNFPAGDPPPEIAVIGFKAKQFERSYSQFAEGILDKIENIKGDHHTVNMHASWVQNMFYLKS